LVASRLTLLSHSRRSGCKLLSLQQLRPHSTSRLLPAHSRINCVEARWKQDMKLCGISRICFRAAHITAPTHIRVRHTRLKTGGDNV